MYSLNEDRIIDGLHASLPLKCKRPVLNVQRSRNDCQKFVLVGLKSTIIHQNFKLFLRNALIKSLIKKNRYGISMRSLADSLGRGNLNGFETKSFEEALLGSLVD